VPREPRCGHRQGLGSPGAGRIRVSFALERARAPPLHSWPVRSLPASHPRRAHRSPGWPALLLLLVAVASVDVAAGPLRAPRPAPAPLAPLTPSASAPAIERACGTSLDEMAERLAEAAEQRAASGVTPLPTPHSADIDGIAVLEDDGTFFFVDKGGNSNLDIASAGRAFYRTHGDDYDQVVFWLTTGLTNWLGSPSALAAAWPIQNIASGIGLSLYDYNAALGLPPRVQTILTMNGLQKYPNDPAATVVGLPNYNTQDVLAHEFGHQWLAYPYVESPVSLVDLLGRALQHWSFFFDAEGSVMEGADWAPAGPDTFWSMPPIARFGPLDQYLMGVRASASVDSFFVIDESATFVPPGPYVPFSDPDTNRTAKGPSRRYGIEDVISINGPRVPGEAASPHAMRLAFVLVTPRGSGATPADLAKLATIRSAFPSTVASYTGGRMTVDVTLTSQAGRVRIEHERLSDTEQPSVPRTVRARVSVDPAGIPIAVDPSGVSVKWRIDPGASWTSVPMTPAGPDSFTAVLPGQPSGTTLEYAFHAESASEGIHADLPDLAQSLPFSYRTGPDTQPPLVTHWAQYAQSNERLPQTLLARATDRLGLQSVWCETSLNGGPVTVVPVTAAGHDSFTVALGAGLPRGAKLAYRFVARDASAAQNLGYSNVAFDTMRVGHDHVDGVWNPGPWTHSNVRFNRRDEWHVVASPLAGAPAGSGAWHCGLDSLPYGPYQDAALMSGLVFGIAPGCSLTFAHRYDLEQLDSTLAFDAMRIEVSQNGAEFVPVNPVGGYTHNMILSDQGIPDGAPCWSGRQDGWRVEHVDLSPFAPGPIRVRFRMSSDLFVGAGGWWVDDIRFHFPDEPTLGVGPDGPVAELGPMWPNPAAAALRQSLRLTRAARVEWDLYDVAGRRVATLWRGSLDAGSHELSAAPARTLAGGLYFSRVSVDGRALEARRVALVR